VKRKRTEGFDFAREKRRREKRNQPIVDGGAGASARQKPRDCRAAVALFAHVARHCDHAVAADQQLLVADKRHHTFHEVLDKSTLQPRCWR
jgi:hypothetical protein